MAKPNTTTTHTPGPWTCDDTGFVRDAEGRVVAAVSAISDDADESVSNGFLVQAAPELLAACRAMLRAVDELMTEYVSKQRAAKWDVINQAGWDAGAAIRRATKGA